MGGSALQVRRDKGSTPNPEAHPPPLKGSTGFAHTRWATHGAPSKVNAHPHVDCTGKIALAHNGIIENYASLREKLEARGHKFVSQTDTESLVHLIESYYDGDLETATRKALRDIRGSYAVLAVHADEPGKVIGARNESPLVVGLGPDENFLASDVPALLRYTDRVAYVMDREMVVITPKEVIIKDIARIPASAELASEYRYSQGATERPLVLLISQSGETADTLGAAREAHRRGCKTLAISNVIGSSLSREVDKTIYTRAGIEIGVAATKTFIAQLVVLYLIALKLGQDPGTLGYDQLD